ncbi:MAG: hypothetical protein QG628_885 [Patescibacteria group bacterium]|nr:hypothetical protein [Patescibacteria group bacterium]
MLANNHKYLGKIISDLNDINKILEDVRLYPSPHNSQPIRVKIIDDLHLEIYYDKHYGLPAESFGAQFGYVCTGIFLYSLGVVAGHYGYGTKEEMLLSEMDFTIDTRLHLMAKIELSKLESPQNPELYGSFLKRQTSRIPYDNKLVDETAIQEAKQIAIKYGQLLNVESDATVVSKIIDINQKTLFLDMENDAVYNELMEWLRFSEAESMTKADGLSAKTMLINGSVLKFFMKHRALWNMPVIGKLVKKIYLNTMRGVRQVAWLTGPFENYQDYINSGKCFMEVWLCLTKHNVHLHPYGTVITNSQSHKAFVELVSEKEDGAMAWMLFRLGYSDVPPKSYRRPLDRMIINEDSK